MLKNWMIKFSILFLAGLQSVFAGAFKIPHHAVDISGSAAMVDGDQLYSERPDISKVSAHDRSSELPSAWKLQKPAHLEAVAEILEMYPDRHIYFLARDGELLYDCAKTLLGSEPAQLERIHLLNISRLNMIDPHLLKYLAQEGISLGNLQKGMKTLFADTGFAGTIPKTISEHLLKDLPATERAHIQTRLQTHLLASDNLAHPSTRVFLESVHRNADELSPRQIHASIVNYENMPRFTYRANSLKVDSGQWQPVGTLENGKNAQVHPGLSLKYMEDLKHYTLSEVGKELWERQRAFWRQMRQLLDSEQPEVEKKIKIESKLKTLLASDDPLRKHRVRDILELITLNEPHLSHLLPSLSSLGLKEIGAIEIEGTKSKVIERHPEWANILNNPIVEIPKLARGADDQIQLLRQITDEIDDDEIKKIIADSVIFSPPESPMIGLQFNAALQTFKAILEKNNWGSKIDNPNNHILAKVFNEKNHSHSEFLEAALKSYDPEMRRAAAFSLGYAQIGNVNSLFSKALVDDLKDVRNAAISSLIYRRPNDLKTFEMLVKILKHPDPFIRKDVATLVQKLYPNADVHPLHTYLNSQCEIPIHEMPEFTNLDSALAPILSTLNDVNTIASPLPRIFRLTHHDPRATHASERFKALGGMHLAAGLIWSDEAPTKMNQRDAVKYCANLGDGARLPTQEEMIDLSRAMGSRDPGRLNQEGYKPENLTGMKGKGLYWSSSIRSDGDENFAYVLHGDKGFVKEYGRAYVLLVRCVR